MKKRNFFLRKITMILIIISFQSYSKDSNPDTITKKKFIADLTTFNSKIKPIIDNKCLYCHGPKKQKADFRIDKLNPNIINGNDDERWHEILDLITVEDMPPEEAEESLTDEEFFAFENWIRQELNKRKKTESGNVQPVLRRLTKDEYTNTIKDLLDIDINAGDLLPPEALSEEGFENNGETLIISPLHIRYFIQISRTVLDKVIQTSSTLPKTYRYRWIFGDNPKNTISNRGLGYQSIAVPREFQRSEIFKAKKDNLNSATYQPKLPLDKILNSDLRGSKFNRYQLSKMRGITLSPMIPNAEKGANIWQGPSPNLKILMQDFPTEGNFRVNIIAKPIKNPFPNIDNEIVLKVPAKTPPFLTFNKKTKEYITPKNSILRERKKGTTKNNKPKEENTKNNKPKEENTKNNKPKEENTKNNKPKEENTKNNKPKEENFPTSINFTVKLNKPAIYQIDIRAEKSKNNKVVLKYNDNRLELAMSKTGNPYPFAIIKLNKGINKLKFINSQISHIALTPIKPKSKVAQFIAKGRDKRKNLKLPTPYLKAFLGNRLDDGMQYRTMNKSIPINKSDNYATYTFHGLLENFPLPLNKGINGTQKDFLAGTMIFGIWNDIVTYDKTIMDPAVAIKQIEFEAPVFYEWPPKQHKAIFIKSKNSNNESLYAREIIKKFVSRAYRRPIKADEISKLISFWKTIRPQSATFEQSIKETLVPVLCSPSFLYRPEVVIDKNNIKNKLDDYELASRLSYFLWSSMPDQELFDLAAKNQLRTNLKTQIQRLLLDKKAKRFTDTFSRQWLNTDRLFDTSIKASKYPNFNRYVKEDFKKETQIFVNEIFSKNYSILNFIDSDFVMVNQNLAYYYKLKEKVYGPEFRPVLISKTEKRGGLLTHGSFLAGHSTGEDSHPIKRGVWLAKRLLDTPPPKPPPNIPEIPLEDPEQIKRPVKEQLKLHRDKASCRSCHKNIDPWGIIFENYDASGSWREKIIRDLPNIPNPQGTPKSGGTISLDVDSSTEAPDGTKMNGLIEAKNYILNQQREKFTRSIVKHLLIYGLGRSLSYKDEEEIKKILKNIEKNDYKAYSLVNSIIESTLFIDK